MRTRNSGNAFRLLLEGAALGVSTLMLHGCGNPEEAPSVELRVFVDDSGIAPLTTDLDYEVELSEARLVIEDITFALAGEAHTASLWSKVSDYLIPKAYAHPGHFQGGDVTGELRGRFLLDWLRSDGETLGTARLLVGSYKSANFMFAVGDAEDGIAKDDPLLGHTALLSGRASREDAAIDFTILIESPAGRPLTGAPFEFDVRETTKGRLGVRLLTEDPLENDTLFDGVDFFALDGDGDGEVAIEPSSTDDAVSNAYNLVKRAFQTHDHFDIRPSPPKG